MAPVAGMKTVQWIAAVILVIFAASANSECKCRNVPKQFNTTTRDVVYKTCRRSYVFTYDFSLDEDWAASLCVSSPLVSANTPLLVVVREYLSVTSFQVPKIFEDKRKSSFTDVCRTLCPLANYFDDRLSAGEQLIFVEIATQSPTPVEFEMRLSTVNDFVMVKDQPLTVNITPSKPRVMQYKIEEELQAVRIEATSSDKSCMILAIDNIHCPFYDSESTVEHSGYFQTLMTQSGISVSKNTFPMGRMYVILVLKTTNDACLGSHEIEPTPGKHLSKEVTLRIVPTITDGQYYSAVLVPLSIYLAVGLIAFIICWIRRINKGNLIADVEIPNPRNSTTSSIGSVTNPLHAAAGQRPRSDEINMDELPPDKMNPVVIRQKTYIFVADLAKKSESVLSIRSKLYSWNLVTCGIFFAVPAIQLVYVNQGLIPLTGNQDLCYYNFLCSYHFWVFRDFNHVWSNIGYVLLGIIFLLLVWRRECSYKEARDLRRVRGEEATGIPYHFGLYYAMGWASIMEGVLSATYHFCPHRANFQFDTAFMYVIAIMCMLRIYQARHPDITAKSHVVFLILSGVIMINAGELVFGGIAYQVIFGIVYLIAVFLVSVKIYYMGCAKCNEGIFKHVHRNRQAAVGTRYYSSHYKVQFVLFYLVMLGNLVAWIVCDFVNQWDFATFFLVVFLSNLLIYLLYYIIIKFYYHRKKLLQKRANDEAMTASEKKVWVPAVFFALSTVSWCVASYYFFFERDAEWQHTPAISRQKNSHCFIGDFYDHHDFWHFTSSFGIFFSYMALLTLEDDQEEEPRDTIEAF